VVWGVIFEDSFFQSCFLLHVEMMHGWRRICKDKMAQFCRMSCLFNLCMIGRWKRLVDFLRCYILLKLDVKERINCVGFQGTINPLKSSLTVFVSIEKYLES